MAVDMFLKIDGVKGESTDTKLPSRGAGNDTLLRTDGGDNLNGGPGNNTLICGTGADTFPLGESVDSSPYYLGDGNVIIGFNEYDEIAVKDVGRNSYSSYSFAFGNCAGGNALDTRGFFPEDLIGVVQDYTNSSFPQDFTFV